MLTPDSKYIAATDPKWFGVKSFYGMFLVQSFSWETMGTRTIVVSWEISHESVCDSSNFQGVSSNSAHFMFNDFWEIFYQ